MSEDKTEPSGATPQRRRFVAKKQPTPKWIFVVFIGFPSVVIVVLTVLLLAKVLGGGGGAEEPDPPDTNEQFVQARKKYEEARRLSTEYKRLSDDGNREEATKQYRLAMAALSQGQQVILPVIDGIKKELGVKVLPPEYGEYVKLAQDIQQAKADLLRMAPF
jgi:hypothetical protein